MGTVTVCARCGVEAVGLWGTGCRAAAACREEEGLVIERRDLEILLLKASLAEKEALLERSRSIGRRLLQQVDALLALEKPDEGG